jgi:hypothetical protein
MKHFSFLLAPLGAGLASGCLAPPPCPEPNTASAAADGAAAPAAADGAASPAAAAAPADPGDLSKPLVVWNGDDVSPTAKEWASCDTKPCTTTLLPTPKVGKGGSIGLEFKASAKGGYVGFGWNWTSWYKGGATNITGRKALKFSILIKPTSAEVAPAGDAIRVRLGCAKVDKCGKLVPSLAKYDAKVLDGQWHDITIPLADMKTEDKDEWDDATAWEFQLHNWAPTPREFVAHIDDIRFE